MRSKVFASVAIACVLILVGKTRAGGSPRATQLKASPSATTVTGQPVDIRVYLSDARGPVEGGLVRLVMVTRFFGADHQEVLDEATTGPDGKATLTFSPADTGTAQVVARYEGDAAHAGSQAAMTFDVRTAATVYHPTPVGIQAPWAHSYLILLPFFGVWITYLVVLNLARGVRRAGAQTVQG